MAERLKRIKYYSITKEEFEGCRLLIADGNDMSLMFMSLFDAIFLLLMTFINAYVRNVLPYTAIPALFAVAVCVVFMLVKDKTTNYHYVFYYLTVECQLIYGIYAMSMQTLTAGGLYTAVLILLPLFYMHNFEVQSIFSMSNLIIFVLLALMGGPRFEYLQSYMVNTIAFTVLGLAIHYVYQSNRIREIFNFHKSKENERILAISSTFETLTGLFRRSAFVEFANKKLNTPMSDGFSAMCIMDIDYFKFINDTYGHQLGDAVITEVGAIIAETLDVKLVRPKTGELHLDEIENCGNIAGRLGGDEYIMFIDTASSKEEVIDLLNRLKDKVASMQIGRLTGVRCSIGVSMIDEGNRNYDVIYHEADTALYVAKECGRNQIVTYKKKLEVVREELRNGSDMDTLTGLLTQETFKKMGQEVLSSIKDQDYVICFSNIENFKTYNSKYGFEQGNLLLIELAKQLQEEFPDMLISRFNDDHFVGIAPKENLEHRLGKVRFRLRDFKGLHLNAIRTGVYNILPDDDDINILCDRAKFACDSLRGRYDIQLQYYDESLDNKKDRYQYVIDHIDEAIDKEWIQVFYQPIISTKTDKCVDTEALARWIDPELGLLSPAEFIESLEQSRLIYKLDLYMVDQICKNYRRCIDAGLPIVPVSVNLSRLDFESVDVITEIENAIEEYGVPRDVLHIEITESALTHQKDRLREIVGQFQHIGYQIWMDDFGSGYSSLNVLKDYQFNVVKFDMEFLSDTGDRAKLILSSIVDMSRKLGLMTLAEGVETEEQFRFLKEIGCDYAQGYLFSRPVPFDEFQSLIGEKFDI